MDNLLEAVNQVTEAMQEETQISKQSVSGERQEMMEEEEDQDSKLRKTSLKRAMQNRAAQKAFRLRKEAHLKKLESEAVHLRAKVQDLEKACYRLPFLEQYEAKCKELEFMVQRHYQGKISCAHAQSLEREIWIREKHAYEERIYNYKSKLLELGVKDLKEPESTSILDKEHEKQVVESPAMETPVAPESPSAVDQSTKRSSDSTIRVDSTNSTPASDYYTKKEMPSYPLPPMNPADWRPPYYPGYGAPYYPPSPHYPASESNGSKPYTGYPPRNPAYPDPSRFGPEHAPFAPHLPPPASMMPPAPFGHPSWHMRAPYGMLSYKKSKNRQTGP